jgi:hypothetical protein
MSVYTIFPKRGIVDPSDSLISLGGASGPVQDTVYLPFDVTSLEAPEYSATPTQSLVESSKTISDHIVVKPLRLKLEGVISDTPLSGTPFGSLVNGAVSAFSGSSPSKKAFDYIENLFKTAAIFDFVGGFKIYQNMCITEFRPTRTAETGSALEFVMELQQLNLVNSLVLVKPGFPGAGAKGSHGGQPMASANQQDVATAGSAASQPANYYLDQYPTSAQANSGGFGNGMAAVYAWLYK